MNSRDILRKALNHQAGPVPVDFGSTAVTGMHVQAVEGLREHYGLAKQPVKVIEPYQMLGAIEDDLRTALGVGTTGVFPPKTLFGFAVGNWKEWRAPWGQELLVPGNFNVEERGDGTYIYPEGDMTAAASGHMPTSGYFFDTIVRQKPIDEDKLDPQDNLEEFGVLSDGDLAHYKMESEKAARSGFGVTATFPGMAFGDIALVPAPFLKDPKGIRDITEWYISTATRQDYVRAMFDKQLEYALVNLAKLHEAVGDRIDAVFICGTDFGTQNGPFCSPDTFKSLWAPYYTAINQWIHENTGWKTFKHSCGAIYDFLEPLVECGFDIINPVQCSAVGMDPARLKKEFGSELVFWGGGVDTQKTLPFGAPDEVRKEVLQRCEIFSVEGGFVFDAIHNVQANTPIENIVAMIEAVREFNAA